MTEANATETVVVKYGSNCLVDGESISQERINGYADELELVSRQHSLAIVTSGAVAVGKRRWKALYNGHYDGDKDDDNQVFASMGSAGITEAWYRALLRNGLLSGQILVTHAELRTEEADKLRKLYEERMKGYIVPIINQNDALVTRGEKDNELDKLELGADNDWLATDVATCLAAKALIICTDGVDGMMVDGKVKHEIRTTDVQELVKHCFMPTDEGSGGMDVKLLTAAAWVEQSGDNEAYICNAGAELTSMLAGEEIGTRVVQ